MKKKELITIGTILILAGLLAGVRFWYRQSMTDHAVIIQVDGREYLRVSTDKPQKITVSQPDGQENVVEITENGVRMYSANCPNNDCVRQGEVTRENMDYRPSQGLIICLPNRVSVELRAGGGQ